MKQAKFIETICRIKPYSTKGDTSPISAASVTSSRMSQRSGIAIPYNVYKDQTSDPTRGIVNLRPRNPYCPELTEGYSYNFAFNSVMGEDGDQSYLFEVVGKPMIENLFGGFNGCILCYGQTNTGKTYTMCGGQREDDGGLIPRCTEGVFARIDADPHVSVTVSYIEIYNECAYDLLANSTDPNSPIESWPRLTLRYDDSAALCIQGLSRHLVTSFTQAMDLFTLGNYNKMVSSTPMNQASSRSHCIFSIELRNGKKASKLNLVDLAGSERVWKSKFQGDNLKEARYINKSLHFLEHVVLALGNVSKHIPYRNSILTNILRDSIGGKCRTCLIANISVDEDCLKETLATCRFAQRCSQVQVDLSHSPAVNPANLSPAVPSLPICLPGSCKFIFEAATCRDKPTIRDFLDESGSNLSQFPRACRSKLIEHLRTDGMDIGPINCVGDLCAVVQVLIAKLSQSDDEKRELKIELEKLQKQIDNVSEVSVRKTDLSSSSDSSNRSSKRPQNEIPVISINLSDFERTVPYSPPQWRKAKTHGSFEIPTPVDN